MFHLEEVASSSCKIRNIRKINQQTQKWRQLGDCTLNNPFFFVIEAIFVGISLGLVLYEFEY
jgi:hypothetical protein